MTAQTSHSMPTAAERTQEAPQVAGNGNDGLNGRISELAESLRTMRSSARRHHDGAGGKARWSIVLDAQWIGDLTDAADLIEQQAAALLPLANAAAPIEREMLTDAQVECAQEALYGKAVA